MRSEVDCKNAIERNVYSMPVVKIKFDECKASNFLIACDIQAYLENLFRKHGVDRVKAVVMNLCPIKGSWADTKLFSALDNIIRSIGIEKRYVYPTNIFSLGTSSSELDENDFFSCIERLKPMGQIHSDYCEDHQVPHKIHFFHKGETSAEIRSQLVKTSETFKLLSVCFAEEPEFAMPKLYEILVNHSGLDLGVGSAAGSPIKFSEFSKTRDRGTSSSFSFFSSPSSPSSSFSPIFFGQGAVAGK